MADLFSKGKKTEQAPGTPLAERMRPRKFDDFLGQEEIIAPDSPLRQILLDPEQPVPSMIFWGPPGSGKTTLARLIASETKHFFVFFSAVTSGVKEVRQIIQEAHDRLEFHSQRTILFVDEIHRFNKAQQDAFLPHVENGSITIIGATTENPSFEVISALLSRCQIYTLKRLEPEHLERIVLRALQDKEGGLGKIKVELDEDALKTIAVLADGDARKALNYIETSVHSAKPEKDNSRHVTKKLVTRAIQKKSLLYDKTGEEHYNIISALHKSLRGSDPQAALYWLARMLEGGEDPLYVARRLIRFASEDIGLADPQALVIAVAAKEAVHFIGMPECNNALAQVTVYLATAPKSNALYVAYNNVARDVNEAEAEPVPLHIRNAPTGLMKDLGYGKGYKYPHDYAEKFVAEEYLPESLQGKEWYVPGQFGFEKEVKKRLDYWKKMKQAALKKKKNEKKD